MDPLSKTIEAGLETTSNVIESGLDSVYNALDSIFGSSSSTSEEKPTEDLECHCHPKK